jgi:hypothetical protein
MKCADRNKSARIVNVWSTTMAGKEQPRRPWENMERKAAVVRVMMSGPATRPFGKMVLAVVTGLLDDCFGVYHPERHYMRGPGPKWREKHAVRAAALRPNADGSFVEAATVTALPHP